MQDMAFFLNLAFKHVRSY